MLYRLLTPSVSCVLLSFLDYRDYSTFTASSRQLNLLLNRAAVLAGQVYRPPSSSPLLLFRILIGFDHRFHVSVNGYGEDDGLDLVWLRSARTALALALMPSPEPDSPWSRPAAYVLEAELRSGRMMQAMMAQPGLQGCVETLIRIADDSLLTTVDFPGLDQFGPNTTRHSVSLIALCVGMLKMTDGSVYDAVLGALAVHRSLSTFVPYDKHGNWCVKSSGDTSTHAVPTDTKPRKHVLSSAGILCPVSHPNPAIRSDASHASFPWLSFRPQLRVVTGALLKLLSRKFPDLTQYLSVLGVDLRAVLNLWLSSAVFGALGLDKPATEWILLLLAGEGWPGLMWLCASLIASAAPSLLRCSSPSSALASLSSHARAVLSPPSLPALSSSSFPLWAWECGDALAAACGLTPPVRVCAPGVHPAIVRTILCLPKHSSAPTAELGDSAGGGKKEWGEEEAQPSRPHTRRLVWEKERAVSDISAITARLPNKDGTPVDPPAVSLKQPAVAVTGVGVQVEVEGKIGVETASVPVVVPNVGPTAAEEEWGDDMSSLLGQRFSPPTLPVEAEDTATPLHTSSVSWTYAQHALGPRTHPKRSPPGNKYIAENHGPISSLLAASQWWVPLEADAVDVGSGSMTRMLAEAVARYPHLSRLAAVSDSEFMASHAPKASAVSHDKSELFQRFVDEERSSVALTPLDEGKGVDARKGEPLTLDDLEFVHEPGFNWDDPLFLEKAVETPARRSSVDWGERLISTKSGRNALEVAGIPPLKPPMTPGRDGTGNGSGKRSAGLAVFKRGLNRHLHPQDPPPASSPPHAVSGPMRVQSPSAVKSTATVTARADGIVTPDALHHRPNVSLLRSSYNKKEASRPSSPSGPPPPLPTPYNAGDVTVAHLSSEPLSQDKKDRPSSVRLPRSFQSVLKDSGLNIDSDTLELPLWESEATHQQPARLAEWASVEARLFAVKQPPAVVTEPPSPPKRPPTPTSPAQGLSSPLSSAITLQSGLAAVPKSAPRRRAPGRPGSAASSVATVGTGSVAFTPATPPATPPTDNRSLLPNLPAVVVRPLVQDPSVFPASIIPPRPSGYNSGSRSPAESTVILHGAGVDGSLAEPLEAVEDGIDRLSVPPPPGTVVISSVPLPSAANVVNLISAAVRDEEEGRRLRERAHTEELEEKGEGTSSGVEAPTIAGLLGRKHQVPQSASRSRRSSGVSARVGAGVEEPAVPITSSRLPLLHWPPPHEFSARSYEEMDEHGNCTHEASGFVFNTHSKLYAAPPGFAGSSGAPLRFSYDPDADVYTQWAAAGPALLDMLSSGQDPIASVKPHAQPRFEPELGEESD